MDWLWFLFSLKGRIDRKSYWLFFLSVIGGLFLVGIISEISDPGNFDLYIGISILLVLWPILAVTIKRWHDRGRNTWWIVLAISPIFMLSALITLWVLIESLFFIGSEQDNQFGSSPIGLKNINGKTDKYSPLLIIILISLVIGNMSFSSYRIPSGSMMPTLLIGDYLIVNNLTYGIPVPFVSKEALPLRDPNRGDVIVFHYPPDPSIEYIQRVVGLPGDRIAYYRKQIYLNGQPIPQGDPNKYVGAGSSARETGSLWKMEKIGEKSHTILVHPFAPDYAPNCTDLEGHEITIPEGGFLVLGDNRDNSNDSRCWGLVPRSHILGKATMLWMNYDSARDEFPIKFSRLGKLLH